MISGFISDEDSQMQRRILKRLDDLMKMQGEFQMALSMHDTRYEPPQAYFHYFPVKPFVKIEKKSTKKGKKADKSLVLANPEWETFDLGSLLVSKNPTYFRKLDIKVFILFFFYFSLFIYFSFIIYFIIIIKNFFQSFKKC